MPGSDTENKGADEYNTLPETPAPFSPSQGRSGGVVSSSSPRLGFSDMPSTPFGRSGLGSQLLSGGMAGQPSVLSSQLDTMAATRGAGTRRRDLGSRAQALTSELGSVAESEGAQATEIRTIWGTVVHVRDVMQAFRDFLEHFTPAHCEDGAAEGVEPHEPVYLAAVRRMHALEIAQLNLDAQNLRAYAPSRRLYAQLCSYPEEVVPIMDYVLAEVLMELEPEADVGDVRVRPYNLDATTNMRALNPGDIDKLVSVRGLVVRASPVVPELERAFFRCVQCDWSTTVGIDRGGIAEPTQCGNPGCLQRDAIELVHNRSRFADTQLCRLQETPETIPAGQTPHAVTLVMHDELVDACRPGDRVEVTGVYRGVPVRPNPRARTVSALYRTYLDAVHVRPLGRARGTHGPQPFSMADAVVDQQRAVQGPSGDPHDAKAFSEAEVAEFERLAGDPRLLDILAASLAPSIHEMDDVKRGLLLQLFGGVRKHYERSGAPRSRGDINVLLVGDPGVSKSQLLSHVHALAPRGIYTSGKGSSAVGLTAYVTRDPDTRQLVLESGALVLSDDGVCAIDEFDKMSEATRSVLHEVMEQQTISIAKAGIITSLNARTSILAAANPVDSKWNRELSIVENMNLPPTLVSRFDLVFIVLDTVDETADRRLARHIVGLYMDDEPAEDAVLPRVDAATLTRYIAYARAHVKPEISDAAATALVSAYVDLRKMGRDSAATTAGAVHAGTSASGRITATARQLESMIRMSEAHAKMRLSRTVERGDVDEAAKLMREALRESATDPRTGLIDLDLINTGFAASDRRQLDAIKRETRKMLVQNAGGPSNSATYQVWLDRLNEQSYAPVPPRLFDQVIKELQTEGAVGVVGAGRSMLIVVKQSALN